MSWLKSRCGPGKSCTCSIGRGHAIRRPDACVRTMRPKRVTTAWLSDGISRMLLTSQTTMSSSVTA